MSRLPDFFVIGVVKGGTTSLYSYLSQHPEIHLPAIKETNHFASADIQAEHFLPTYAQDVDHDLDTYFDKGMPETIHIAHVNRKEHYQKLYSSPHQAKRVGDVSNSYMICPSSAKAIHEHDPSAKLVVVLRNPIRRAWSQYLMNIREAKVSKDSMISEFEYDTSRSPKGWGVSHQYLELGHYAEQISRYQDLFPKEQLHIIFYEQYRAEPLAALKALCEFLNVDSSFSFDLSEKKNKASRPRSAALNKLLVESGLLKRLKDAVPKSLREGGKKLLYSEKGLATMSPEEEDYLRTYYEEQVASLSQIVGPVVWEHWPEFKPIEA